MKTFNWIFILLFVLFAALQYNDPDPYIWVPVYLYAAFLCWLAIQQSSKKIYFIIGLLAYSGYALYLFFDATGVLNWALEHHAENIAQSMKATKPWIEETREFLGLFIIIVVISINLYYLNRKRRLA